jgi:hypothetical protein
MIVGLDKKSASAALQSPTVAACARIAKPELASWIGFYRAVAARDFPRVKQSVEKLLQNDETKKDKQKLAYILAAALVAHQHTGTLKAGQELWINHEETFKTSIEVPFYLKLAIHGVYRDSKAASIED